MEIFSKSILNKEQIKARTKLDVDGLEVYLTKNSLENPETKDLLTLCSDSFPVVNLETGDRLYGTTPMDLLDDESREYIEKTLEIRETLFHPGVLVVHLTAGCQVLPVTYKGLTLSDKEENIEAALEYIHNLDPENKVIAPENTFPTDWMDEEKGIISFYRGGKLSSDFGNRIRTFDTAHSGISMYTFSNLIFSREGAFFNHPTFGDIPVYFGDEERKIAQISKKSLTDAVCREIETAARLGEIVNVHLNNSQGLLDGYSISEEGDLNLTRIIKSLRVYSPEATFVVEVKERSTGDYLNVPNQKEMIKFLRTLK